MSMNNKEYTTRLMGLRFPGRVLLFLILLLTTVFSFTRPGLLQAAAREFPSPKWLDNVTVADQMIINGLPSSVRYFEASRELDDLLDYYRKRWNDGPVNRPGYREMNIAPWHIISRLDGRYLYTVQAQEDGPFSIRGYLAVADLKEAKKNIGEDRDTPRMKGSRIINRSTSIDPGAKGQTLMLVNNSSISANSDYYRNYYQERGWTKLVDMESEESRVLTFKKYRSETQLVIMHINGATQVVMNSVVPD